MLLSAPDPTVATPVELSLGMASHDSCSRTSVQTVRHSRAVPSKRLAHRSGVEMRTGEFFGHTGTGPDYA
jgi:hypothetical protein